jgi:hypothetical protein
MNTVGEMQEVACPQRIGPTKASTATHSASLGPEYSSETIYEIGSSLPGTT